MLLMLLIRPISLKHANEFVISNHRHNGSVLMHKFSLSVYDNDRLCGVAIVSNPVARRIDDGLTLEVRRVCTDGTFNACSILYSRCARIARDMGYKSIITYTLESETGSSLLASGWKVDCTNVGSNYGWDNPSRPRDLYQSNLFDDDVIHYPLCKKTRWIKNFY